MNSSHKHAVLFIALALLMLGVVARLFPHLPNATPITAIAFVGSFYLGRRWVIVLPLFALLLSDVVIGFYDWRIMASVYGSFALIACWSYISRTYRGLFPVFLAIVGSSLFFFFITNGAVWLFSPWYEKSIVGLLYAYELGIPFLRNMLLGDLIYSAVLFGAFELARSLQLGRTFGTLTDHGYHYKDFQRPSYRRSFYGGRSFRLSAFKAPPHSGAVYLRREKRRGNL